ncbi:PREDICTED: membrane-spanning 4-domains subfamily A member 12 isoform X2 [Colobus angolensis palliatus]|uniref:membrane-spanning 4-domains subfamily A member 12 isoform X2 n=1 Tax=Colobus angolensis palliatus TaxID=336983 RepID=UPI0005F5451D|nr:PREDICTED: membrane-spanning 4-domains subfamily A member 12 isoform X2 [Colobus angolensis palliatus]
MVSSEPTSHAGVYETTPNPYYPPSSFMAPGSQQPPGSINLENQAQGAQSAQLYFITSPGTSAVSQLGQRNTQMINPSVGTAVINFKEEAKALGFIISGSLTVSASKELSSCLVKGSLGMNIVSSIFAFLGVILLVVDTCIHGLYPLDYWAMLSGKGISAMLIIFSFLEVCTACATAYFANQANTMIYTPVLVTPNTYENNPVIPASSSAPPRCNNYSN